MKQHLDKVKSAYHWFISGIWFVQIMRQVIITGGNVAESAFLLATLWVIVNAVAHTVVVWVMDTQVIELLNNLSAIAFSALPELIIIPVIIICYDHWSNGIKRKSPASYVWAILYSIPAGFFLVMTIVTIATFVSTKGTQVYVIDGQQLVIRCLAGWMYAVVNMLFKKLGEPHYASKMQNLETIIDSQREEIERLTSHFESALQTANANFKIAMDAKQNDFEYQIKLISSQSKSEIESLQNQLKTQSLEVNRLAERASSLQREDLALYPKVRSMWIESKVKTVTLSEIESVTGLSRQRINAAAKAGKFQKDNRKKDGYRVSSVVEWLKTLPVEKAEQKERNTDPLPATNGHRKVTQPLGDLVLLEV